MGWGNPAKCLDSPRRRGSGRARHSFVETGRARNSGEQRPARAVPSQGQPCPAAPRPGHPLPSPRSHWNRAPSARKSSPRRDPRLLPSDSVCCRGEPAFAAGGNGGTGRRRARGTRKLGTKTLAGRVTGPRAGSGGRWRSRKQLCGEGGQRRGPPTPPRLSVPGLCRRPVCAKPLAASGWPCVFVARIRGLCWGFECILACGRPLLPRRLFGGSSSGSGPRFQAVSAGGGGWGWLRWVVGGPPGAAGRGATGVLWATSPKEGNQVERVSVRALALWLSGRHRIDWGVVVTRMQGDCPLGKVHG